MPVNRPDLDLVGEADLAELVTSGTGESQTLEFKRETYGNSDADKRELLKDVSALANTRGGHLIIGVDEADGTASGVPGAALADMDAEARRLDSIIATGIEPRVAGVKVKPIRLNNGNACVVIRVPASWHQPHRVSFQRWNKFFVRRSLSVEEAGMSELRDLFIQGSQATHRFREFHRRRFNEVGANNVRPLVAPGRFVLHIAPLAAFTGDYAIDPSAVRDDANNLRPIASAGFSPRFNFDGFVVERGGDRNFGYTQVFRNGILESDVGRPCVYAAWFRPCAGSIL